MATRQARSTGADVAICEDCKKEGPRKRVRGNRGKRVLVSLEIAAINGHVECLQALLNAGADVNYVNSKNENTALALAAANGKDQCVELLIKAGADVNNADYKGNTALMLASGHGNIKSVELLLEAGADVNKRDIGGDTALMFAISHNDILTLLIKAGADVNSVNETGSTAVHSFAVSRGDGKCAETLAKAGADLNFLCDGQTPLMYATVEECYKSAEALINSGADVNKVNEGGANVLHWAPGSSKAFYELFIKAGVDVNAKTSHKGQTPLLLCMDCSCSSQYDVAEMLIEADVNITWDGNLPTALFYADETGSVKLLLRSGARINIRNNDGNNALERWLVRKKKQGRNKGEKLDEFCLVLLAAGETVNEVKCPV